MKKLVLAIFVVVTSCAPYPTAIPTKIVTTTPLVIPQVTVTPAPTRTPVVVSPTPTATPTGEYTVMPGDTLGSISEKFGPPVFYIANVNQIADINLIFPGQMLIIPEWPPKDGKQIIVDLSEQKVYVYEDGKLLKVFIVSTGTADHPTVIGHFQIYIKLIETTMTDNKTYFLKHVPYTMYFYQGYGLHGTYWHHNFGTPMSHGCVNLKTDPDAKWLFEWAEVGTSVWVIP